MGKLEHIISRIQQEEKEITILLAEIKENPKSAMSVFFDRKNDILNGFKAKLKELTDYQELIDSTQGCYIATNSAHFELILDKKPLILESQTINVGEHTTLNDWFFKQTKFVGFLEDRALFFLGTSKPNLFEETTYYYDVTYVFAENRIGKSYRAGSFRDVFLKKDKNGKYFWK